MRQAQIYYGEVLSGILTETDDGEFTFVYNADYIKSHPLQFISFSMINSGTEWLFAPAYDLLNVQLVNPKDDEDTALTLEGKKKKFKLEPFQRFGKGLGLNERQVNGVFNRMMKNKAIASAWIDNSFLSNKLKQYAALPYLGMSVPIIKSA